MTPPCAADTEGDIGVSFLTFREWLNIDGFRASPTLAWHAWTEISCIDGAWRETSTLGTNSVDDTRVPPAPAPILDTQPIDEEQQQLELRWADLANKLATPNPRHKAPEEWIQQLESDDPGARVAARSALSSLLQNEDDRHRIEGALIELVASRHAIGSPVSTASLAMELLGEMRSRLGARAIAKHVDLEIVSPAVAKHRGEPATPIDWPIFIPPFPYGGVDYPAVRALVRIGAPAVPALLDRLADANEQTWPLIRDTLVRIDRNTGAVRDGAREALRGVKDDRTRRRIEELIEALPRRWSPLPKQPVPLAIGD